MMLNAVGPAGVVDSAKEQASQATNTMAISIVFVLIIVAP
jgi:hypothetical protein